MAQSNDNYTASVINSQKNTQVDDAVFLAMDKEGLILIKNNTRTLLSATVQPSSESYFEDGQHVAIVDYSLSPDKNSVYFCELPSSDADSCRPYIYSVENDIVYPVKIDGERVAFDASKNPTAYWTNAGELVIQ